MNVSVNGDLIIETAPQSMSSKPSVEVQYVEITVGNNIYMITVGGGGIEIEEVNGMKLSVNPSSASSLLIYQSKF